MRTRYSRHLPFSAQNTHVFHRGPSHRKCDLTFGLRVCGCVACGSSLCVTQPVLRLIFSPSLLSVVRSWGWARGGPESRLLTWSVSSARTGLTGVFVGGEEAMVWSSLPSVRVLVDNPPSPYSGTLADPSRSRYRTPALPWAPPPPDLIRETPPVGKRPGPPSQSQSLGLVSRP
jgi:hypothetical protein